MIKMGRNKRRNSPSSPSRSRKRNRSSSTPPNTSKQVDDLYDLRFELNNFLEEHCGVRNLTDFWNFFLKYEAAQRQKASKFDSTKLLNIRFSEKVEVLYEKMPLYTRRGVKMNVPYEKFKYLLNALRTYIDFENKSKFSKLKQLRKTQADLPIASFKEQILKEIQDNQVVLIAGDTGCGKSTQVPQYIIEAGFNRIACTQPRRIACVSLAKRVAHETLTTYKNDVGFQIRFEKTKNKETKVIFLTEGILLRQASDADVLTSYDAIILDEVHERHLNMDFLVGIMKCLLQKKCFKLILMSATINLQLFQEYFSSEGVKTIQVPGRLYPIEINYKPIIKDAYDKKNSRFDSQPYLNILELIDSKYKPDEKGDVLVFLNGFNEINSLANAVTEYAEIRKNWIVLQLHSSLSLEEQDKVFYAPPDGVKKCIISTNIAETSVTIDGVRFVIDSGKVNRMTYENCGVNKLFETTISQDSAKQRSGRAGRTGPGVCFRLYSEEELKGFDAFTPAEIHLVPLENLILNMVTMGLSDITAFPFLEKPSEESLKASLDRLSSLCALEYTESGMSLTPLGNAMSHLPVDLTIAKMLIVSTTFGSVNSALALASLISVQSPLVENKFYETKDARAPYESDHGEPVTLINLYKAWLELKKESSYSRHKRESSRTWSRKRGVEEQRFYEVTKLIEQFRDILHDANLIPKFEEMAMSGSQRAIRKGELKQLRDMRKELKNESKDNRRKKLQMHMNEDEETNDHKKDLKDVEFRISNDFSKLQKLLDETRTDSYKDLMLLKLILTSAFYPQIAIEDEFNSSKTVNERLYHTKIKNYVFMRPTSYFNEHPDFLELNDSDIDVPPNGYFSKRPLSRKHQILIFQKLLETKKTYLINTFRMPALQTLFLFANKIATNLTLTKFVFDDFLSVDCPFLWQGKVILFKAVDLRKKMKKKLEAKLENSANEDNDEEKFYFIQEMTDFMQSNVSYNLKRLLPADIKMVYNNESYDQSINPFDPDYGVSANSLGGVNVTENVIYNCLCSDSYDIEAENTLLSEPFDCSQCNESFVGLGFYDVLVHERKCKSEKQQCEASTSSSDVRVKPNSKKFHCDKCEKDLILTPVDYLKHKKFCKQIKVEKD